MVFRPEVTIATDGSVSYQRGPGGWACVLESNGHVKEFSGIKETATNQTLEMEAVIQSLWKLSRSCKVTIYSDSQYIVKNYNQGNARRWAANGWKTARNKSIANKDMWKTFLALSEAHDLTLVWVKGHDGHSLNTRADKLAVEASQLAHETYPDALERAKAKKWGSVSPKESEPPTLTIMEAARELRR